MSCDRIWPQLHPIVLREIQKNSSHDTNSLATAAAQKLGVSISVAGGWVERGLAYLNRVGVLTPQTGAQMHLPHVPHADIQPVVRAVELRMLTHDRHLKIGAETAECIQFVVTYVMMAQGMTAARSFANQDAPDAYLLTKLVEEGVQASRCAASHQATLTRAVCDVLRQPEGEVSRQLFTLAHAAYALETVFLNPHGVDLGAAVGWRLYLDSNVALRILDSACDPMGGLRRFAERLRRLGTPMFVLGPFLEEMMAHVALVGRQVPSTTMAKSSLVESYVASLPQDERSPILLWYLSGLRTQKWATYREFTERESLDSARSLARRLARMGITVEGEQAVKDLDTGRRESLWSHLRDWRKGDAHSYAARRLRRNEATQVLWIEQLREQGVRAWFLSIDGQLRRALKYVERGRHASYVMTPVAWMFRLNELHWGELDVAGFSELMWAVPSRTPIERLGNMVMARVLETEPELMGLSADFLRDSVERAFASKESLISAQLEGLDDVGGEAAFMEVADQLVPTTVDRVLDELESRRREQGRR